MHEILLDIQIKVFTWKTAVCSIINKKPLKMVQTSVDPYVEFSVMYQERLFDILLNYKFLRFDFVLLLLLLRSKLWRRWSYWLLWLHVVFYFDWQGFLFGFFWRQSCCQFFCVLNYPLTLALTQAIVQVIEFKTRSSWVLDVEASPHRVFILNWMSKAILDDFFRRCFIYWVSYGLTILLHLVVFIIFYVVPSKVLTQMET